MGMYRENGLVNISCTIFNKIHYIIFKWFIIKGLNKKYIHGSTEGVAMGEEIKGKKAFYYYF